MKTKLLGLLCFVMALVVNSSCSSGGKMNDVLKNVPDKTDVVVVGNLKTIIESAGGKIEDSKIKMPSYLSSFISEKETEKLDEANSFLKESGIDVEACALMHNYTAKEPVIVFLLDDKDKFVEAIGKQGFKQKQVVDDVVYYIKKEYESTYDKDYDEFGFIAVNGSCAYYIVNVRRGSSFKPLPYLKKIIEEANEANYADTPYGEYIVDGNAGGVAFSFPKRFKDQMLEMGVSSDIASLYSGHFCMQGNLDKEVCTLNMKLFDEEGKEVSADKLSKFMDVSATIDDKALAFMGENEFMIYALSAKNIDWDNYLDMVASASRMSRSDKAQMKAVLGYLKNIDGTIACGFGLNNGLESIENMAGKKDIMNQFSTTFVIETKEGKAASLLDDVKGLVEKAHLPFEETADGVTIPLDRMGVSGKLCMKSVGNYLVIANHDIAGDSKNELVKNTNFDENIFAFCIGLSKNNKLMRDLGIENDFKFGVYARPNAVESTIKLEVGGDGDDGVIARMAKMIIKIVDKSKEIDRRLSEQRQQEYEDYMAADTLAEDEYYEDSVAYDY